MSLLNLFFPTKDLCYFCKTSNSQIKDFICSDCRDNIQVVNKEIDMKSEYVDGAIYCLAYNKFIREMVHAFKFNQKSYLYKPLAQVMVNTLKELNIWDFDIIMYIPIHRRKEAIRGYNQSELLAEYISQNINIPISKKNLIKRKWTKEQNQLDRISRMNNLKGSFKINKQDEILNKRILLIDDIITTGSTINECSQLLTQNGAEKVKALALTSNRG